MEVSQEFIHRRQNLFSWEYSRAHQRSVEHCGERSSLSACLTPQQDCREVSNAVVQCLTLSQRNLDWIYSITGQISWARFLRFLCVSTSFLNWGNLVCTFICMLGGLNALKMMTLKSLAYGLVHSQHSTNGGSY